LAAFPGAEEGPLTMVNLIYEIIFAISIMLKFLYEYKIEDAEQPPVRDLQKIGMRYLKDQFIWDFIPIIPFPALDFNGYERLFYLIKIMRLVNGFKVFSVPAIMEKIKFFAKRRLDSIIKDDPEKAECIDEDNNKISALIKLKFTI
jgi:hypothetical protein